MGLFSRRVRSSSDVFHAGMEQDLAAYGQSEFDPQGTDIDPSFAYEHLFEPYMTMAQADPDSFTAALANLALPIGGWTVYGAQRLVVDLIDGDYRGEHYHAMQDAALDWLRSQGVSPSRLSGYEFRRWAETHGAGSW